MNYRLPIYIYMYLLEVPHGAKLLPPLRNRDEREERRGERERESLYESKKGERESL